MRMTIDSIENVNSSYSPYNDTLGIHLVDAPDAAYVVINSMRVCKVEEVGNLISNLQDLQDALKTCCGVY